MQKLQLIFVCYLKGHINAVFKYVYSFHCMILPFQGLFSGIIQSIDYAGDTRYH